MSSQASISVHVRQWLEDIKLMEGRGRDETAMLVYAVNWAESQSRLMLDREHQVCRKLSKFARNRLVGRVGWHESESGRLWD